MANTDEDYLDNLLNSITKVRKDSNDTADRLQKQQEEKTLDRKSIDPDEDFMTATGIAGHVPSRISHNNLKKALSEDDYLKEFERELLNDDDDEPLRKSGVENFNLKNGGRKRQSPSQEKRREYADDLTDHGLSDDGISDDGILSEQEAPKSVPPVRKEETAPEKPAQSQKSPEAAPASKEEKPEISVDELLANARQRLGEESGEEPDLSQSSGVNEADASEPEDKDLMSLLDEDDSTGSSEIRDLLKADSEDSILPEAENGYEDQANSTDTQISLDDFGEAENTDSEKPKKSVFSKLFSPKDSKKKEKKKKKSSEGKKTKERSRKEKNPAENADQPGKPRREETNEEIIREIDAEDQARKAEEEEDDGTGLLLDFLKKRKEKAKEKKEQKEEAKKNAPPKEKKEKKPKPPKPKKQKKPKEEDHSPLISKKVIGVHIFLALSVVVLVVLGSLLLYARESLNNAQSLYDSGNYTAAYERINHVALTGKTGETLSSHAKLLSTLQTKLTSFQSLLGKKKYEMALNSLIQAYGSYKEGASDAESAGLTDSWNSLGNEIIQSLSSQFGITEDQAEKLYQMDNREDYTKEVQSILASLNMTEN